MIELQASVGEFSWNNRRVPQAFIPGCSIHDNTIIFQEVIHSMRKQTGRGGWMTLKVDPEKAYDKMNWSFIRSVLSAFGFYQ